MTRTPVLGIAVVALATMVLAVPNARASTFDFSYSLPTAGGVPGAVTASGVLTATLDPTVAPDAFLVTAISGTRNGEAITGLIPPEGFGFPDNLIFTAGPHLDGAGLSYTVAGAGNDGLGDVSVFHSDIPAGYTEFSNSVGYTPTFTLTEVTTVPEPASLALLGTGLLGIALVARRRHAG